MRRSVGVLGVALLLASCSRASLPGDDGRSEHDGCGLSDGATDREGGPLSGWWVTTVAGSGASGYQDGPALQAQMQYVQSIAVDGNRLYFADACRIRMLEAGTVSTVAGTGVCGVVDGPANQAQVENQNRGMAVVDGVVHFTEGGYGVIRRLRQGMVETVAGLAQTTGYVDGPGDQARFSAALAGLAAGPGQLFIADKTRIRLLENGQVSTVAGRGPEGCVDGPAHMAELYWPWSLARMPTGEVLAASQCVIRRLAGGEVSTFAGSCTQKMPWGLCGSADGPVAIAAFDHLGIAADSTGRVFVIESDRIGMIEGGVMYTLKRLDQKGHRDGPLGQALFQYIGDAAVDAQDRLFVMDMNFIRMIYRK